MNIKRIDEGQNSYFAFFGNDGELVRIDSVSPMTMHNGTKTFRSRPLALDGKRAQQIIRKLQETAA